MLTTFIRVLFIPRTVLCSWREEIYPYVPRPCVVDKSCWEKACVVLWSERDEIYPIVPSDMTVDVRTVLR